MIDVTHQITTVDRGLTSDPVDGALRTMTVAKTYDTTVEDLWDACTTAERIPRWFLPVSGDLRVGGRYQLEGNAGGTVESCDPPHRFTATWEMGEMLSWIEVRISPADGGARFELRHTARVEEHWDQYGPGAVGIGWDLGVVGLTLHLASGGEQVDPEAVQAWTMSPEGLEFMQRSSDAWRDAEIASGEDPAVAERRAGATFAAYTGG